MYQIVMRKGTTEYAMPLLFNVGLICKTPLGQRLIDSGIHCSFIYGQSDWVKLVDELWAKKITDRYYVVKDAGHNMHMENPEDLTRLMI